MCIPGSQQNIHIMFMADFIICLTSDLSTGPFTAVYDTRLSHIQKQTTFVATGSRQARVVLVLSRWVDLAGFLLLYPPNLKLMFFLIKHAEGTWGGCMHVFEVCLHFACSDELTLRTPLSHPAWTYVTTLVNTEVSRG